MEGEERSKKIKVDRELKGRKEQQKWAKVADNVDRWRQNKLSDPQWIVEMEQK